MCGIVGYIGNKGNSLKVLISGLEKLEYRGYDSAGVCFIDNKLNIIKSKGKIENLKSKIDFNIKSNLGIGHTRWATHGEANDINSHPHKVGKITIVHNGIIENYGDLKKQLNVEFKSETDTEVACALLNDLYEKNNDMIKAIKEFKKIVKGAYALGIICDDDYENLYAIKNKSPLIIGIGENENYIASDVPAILEFTNKYVLLEDGEYAKINCNDIIYYSKEDKEIKKQINKFEGSLEDISKNGYDHFMLKEINEQPDVFKKTILKYTENGIESLIKNMPDFSKYESIKIIGCGSAYHAGCVGKTLIEEFGNIPVDVEIASEFRYKKLFLNNKMLVIIISQSGETADTLAALEIAKEHKCDTLGIINVVGSSIARAANEVLYTKAGSEIAVATTKAYSSQITILSLIAFNIGYSKKLISDDEADYILNGMKKIPTFIQEQLDDNTYKEIANDIYKNNNIFFIGRDVDYALSMEGSLKLKEISYINSQAYAAGELKHGTISLIEQDTPVISIVTEERIAEKTISNIKEVKTRGANVILLTTEKLDKDYEFCNHKIVIPTTHKLLQSLITIIPLQLLSYEIAKLRGCDIDKPKNLAKSVTVE